ncbi:hypothetical protein [Ruegeria lacuscaerulensis]|uniref:hypothetical protein n=1 Tax=Ruegeria lacuscaerulensis TaxID=55218 RepID=UPI00147A36D9|nr:hypothetical protein [Ruegeria lacuscaerulensis]
MFVIKNYVTTGGTVACALAIGYLMQNGTPAEPDVPQTQISSVMDHTAIIAGLEDIVLTSSTPAHETPDDTTTGHRKLHANGSAPSGPTDCAIGARARAVPGAAAQLTVLAPCHAGERIDVHHSGLTVTQQTDATGRLEVTIPALSEYAIFLISVGDQAGTVATTHIPDITHFDRVALHWQGNTDLQIHALEFGASYGSTGHVSVDAKTQGAGQVVHLGQPDLNDAQNVQVYSYPAGQSDQTGSITLSVEAEVTRANCGQELHLQSLELRGDQRLSARDLSVTLPECSKAGEFLVLNNLLEDLKIAAK